MLQVTPSAASTLAGARAAQGLPDDFGLRICADTAASSDTTRAYNLSFVRGPEASDQVAETEGTRVFVASEVADSLDDAVLDAGTAGDLVLTRRNQ